MSGIKNNKEALIQILAYLNNNKYSHLTMSLELSPEVEGTLELNVDNIIFEGNLHNQTILGIVTQLMYDKTDSDFFIKELDIITGKELPFISSSNMKFYQPHSLKLNIDIVLSYKNTEDALKIERDLLVNELNRKYVRDFIGV